MKIKKNNWADNAYTRRNGLYLHVDSNKQNKQKRIKLLDTKNKLVVSKGERFGMM